jgi:hypothetical protein
MASRGWLKRMRMAKYRHIPLVITASECRFLYPVIPYRVRVKPAKVLLEAHVVRFRSRLELKEGIHPGYMMR